MSYIGNTPFTAAFLVDTFSGNGSTVAFTMSVAPANTSSILVAVTGVVQDPSTYSVSGTTLTFSAAPPSGTSNISVRYLGIPASGVTTTAYRTVTNFTATAGQTTFSTPSYTVGYIDVYRNGVRLGSADYTATSGTTVVLTNAANAGDAVVTESFYVSSVLNALSTSGGTITGNLNVVGDESVLGKVQIEQDSGSNNRLILRGQPSSSYRWNIDNYSSSNQLRIFRENDATASGGVVMAYFDSTGRFLVPNQPAFCVYGGTTSGTTYTGNTVVVNNGSYYNTSTGVFTAPVAGIYAFTFCLTTGDTNAQFVDIFKNGSLYGGHFLDYVQYTSASQTLVISLAASDYVSAVIRDPSYYIYNARFSGFLIG